MAQQPEKNCGKSRSHAPGISREGDAPKGLILEVVRGGLVLSLYKNFKT